MAIISDACGLSRNRLKKTNCAYTLNKVTDIFLANINEVSAVTTSDAASGCGVEVSTITLAEDAKWYEIQPSNDSASFSDVLNVADNDVRYRTHTLSFSIGGDYDAEAVCDLNALSLGEYLAVAVLASGNAVLLGNKEGNVGLKATTASLTGAATSTDFSGIQVEMSADLTVASMPLKKAALDAIKESAKD